MPLVLDLHIVHDRVGSRTDPTLNGHLRYPNKLDQSLNDTGTDKIRKYRVDYNNNPPNTETDRFFAVSGVQFPVGVTLIKETVLRTKLRLI